MNRYLVNGDRLTLIANKSRHSFLIVRIDLIQHTNEMLYGLWHSTLIAFSEACWIFAMIYLPDLAFVPGIIRRASRKRMRAIPQFAKSTCCKNIDENRSKKFQIIASIVGRRKWQQRTNVHTMPASSPNHLMMNNDAKQRICVNKKYYDCWYNCHNPVRQHSKFAHIRMGKARNSIALRI